MRFSSIIFGFIWKKSLITCTVGLALGFRNSLLDACEINTDHADAGFQPAAPSRFRSLTLTNCCRSRFVVANYVSESPSNAKAAAGAARRQARATSCASEGREPKAQAMSKTEGLAKRASALSVFFSLCVQSTRKNPTHTKKRIISFPKQEQPAGTLFSSRYGLHARRQTGQPVYFSPDAQPLTNPHQTTHRTESLPG